MQAYSLIDKLEDAGMSCAITLCEYTDASQGKGKFLIEFPIKKAGQPLDIDRCAYAMVHPSMLRKICFALTETEPKAEGGWSGGYGRPIELPYHMRHGCVYFPNYECDVKWQRHDGRSDGYDYRNI